MSTSEGFPYPADIKIRSQFLTASDILTAKKRQLVAASYMSDIRSSRNLVQKSTQRVLDTLASMATQQRDIADRREKTPSYHNPSNTPIMACCTSLISVSSPPTYRRPARLDQ